MNALDKKLREFQNATRELGSSIGLFSSADRLRERLLVVLRLFRENAQSLFPKYIKPKREPRDAPAPRKPTRTARLKATILHRHTTNVEEGAEALPQEMGLLAQDVMGFLDFLEEFPEFIDKAINASITAFQHDLEVKQYSLPTPPFLSILPVSFRLP